MRFERDSVSQEKRLFKIAFLTRGSVLKGSTRVRVLQYVDLLRQHGHEVRVLARTEQGSLQHTKYVIQAARLARWADILFLQKPNQSKLLLDLIYALNRRLMVDIDDAVWIPTPSKSDPTSLRISTRFRDRLLHAIRRSRFVIAGSHYLANSLKSLCTNAEVIVLPPSVDMRLFDRQTKIQNREPVTIGWIGSSPNVSDLLVIEQALKSICDSKRTRLLVVSGHPPKLDGVPFEFQEWTLDTEIECLSKFDIGIMPLRDDERSRGRCGYKAVQYMAMGIPVVSSPVGGGKEVIEEGVTGFYASTPEEWKMHLASLIESSELRQAMGEKGRQRVTQLYSVQSNLPVLLEVLDRVVS